MDEELLKIVLQFASKFYIWEILIILLAILLTTFLKIPITKRALKLQKKYGVDKSMITWISALFPYAICIASCFFLFWYKSGWVLEAVIPASVITEGVLLGSGAIGLYEAIKKFVKAHAAIKEKKEKEEAKAEVIEKAEAKKSEKKTSIYRIKE